jgi:hypothetical protein
MGPGDDNFEEQFVEVMQRWPDVINVTDGAITSVGGGRFPALETIKDRTEDSLIDSGLGHLTEINWAVFTVLHGYAWRSTRICKQHLRKEAVRYIFDRNRTP